MSSAAEVTAENEPQKGKKTEKWRENQTAKTKKKQKKKNPWEAPLTVSGSPFRSRQTKVQRSLFWFFLFFFFLLDRKRRNFLFFFTVATSFPDRWVVTPSIGLVVLFLGFFFLDADRFG